VQDFWALRREGAAHIEALAHETWTDYNLHDPGITLLEALCYALTDLGYRASWPVEDLLAAPPESGYTPDRQGFFTARRILTSAPWTVTDYRKILIDLPGVRNAWLLPKTDACDGMVLYANCGEEVLQYTPTGHPVIVRGLWDVRIAFEEEDATGDLSSGWIRSSFSFAAGSGFGSGSLELRMPTWGEAAALGADFRRFRRAEKVIAVTVIHIAGNNDDDANIPQSALARALRKPLFAKLKIEFEAADGTTSAVELPDRALVVRPGRDADRRSLQLEDIATALEDASASGPAALYLARIKRADAVMASVRNTLHAARNLCEDWCSISTVPVEDVGVCADLDVAPDADIEAVLAEAYALIGEYMAPDVRPHSLESLMARGFAVENIFNGPALQHGFLTTEEVEATGLKTALYASDLIGMLMDIPGVLAVRNFSFARYDGAGAHVESAPWVLTVTPGHQSRLYATASKFLVYKNGLPFLPDAAELADTLQVVRAAPTGAWNAAWTKDLPVPEGQYSPAPPYEPVMTALPRTYGVGRAGLPALAGAVRRAQALQLKGYLLPFEQILADYFASLQALPDLYALDEGVTRTYASQFLTADVIPDAATLYAPKDGTPLTAGILQNLTEDRNTFLDRRNRLLDAVLARFAESFAEYTLVLHGSVGSRPRAQEALIEDKIRFLQALPESGARRSVAFNYRLSPKPCIAGNEAGLQTRLERLLGFRAQANALEVYEETDKDGVPYERRWRVRNAAGKILLSSSTRYVSESFEEAEEKARAEWAQVVRYIAQEERYTVKKTRAKTDKWCFSITDPTGEIIATRKQGFPTEAGAYAAAAEVREFAAKHLLAERMFVVEHLLLRPRNAPGAVAPQGDPLLPICVGANCQLCGEEDPYSFRLTLVMNGEAGLADEGVAARRFAEETIRREVPAHLGVKVCWVSTAQLLEFEDAWCAWLTEGAKDSPDPATLHNKLAQLIAVFRALKSIHPPATLHDCVDGNDDRRVFLGHTVLGSMNREG